MKMYDISQSEPNEPHTKHFNAKVNIRRSKNKKEANIHADERDRHSSYSVQSELLFCSPPTRSIVSTAPLAFCTASSFRTSLLRERVAIKKVLRGSLPTVLGLYGNQAYPVEHNRRGVDFLDLFLVRVRLFGVRLFGVRLFGAAPVRARKRALIAGTSNRSQFSSAVCCQGQESRFWQSR